MGLTKPIEQYLCSNLLNLDTYILYLKDIIRGAEINELVLEGRTEEINQ